MNRLIPKRPGPVYTSTSVWFAVLFLLLAWLPCVGQDLDFTFKSITVKDGLPSLQVYNVVQDKHGLLWFATDNGICSYDGKSFRTMDVHNLLGTNQVLHLYKQQNGEIWGTTISGALFILSEDDYAIKAYRYNDEIKRVIGRHIVNSLYINDGGLYLSFKSAVGFVKIDSLGNSQAHLTSDYYHPVYVCNAYSSMSNSEEQFTLAAYQEHIDLLKLDGFTLDYENSLSDFFQRTKRRGNEIAFVFNQQIAYQSSGNQWVLDLPRYPFCTGFYNEEIWVGLNHGGLQFYSKSGELIHHTLHGKSVSDVYIDHQGGMWVTTLYSGIFYCASPHIRKAAMNAQGLNEVINIVHTEDEGICIGFNDGRVYRLNSNTYVQTAQSQQTMHSIIGHSPYLSDYVEIHTYDKPRRFELHIGGRIIQLQGDTSITRLPGVSKVVSNMNDELLLAGYLGLFSINRSGKVKLIKTAFEVEDAAKAELGYYAATIKGIYKVDSNGTLTKPGFDDSLRRQPVYLLEKCGSWYGGATSGNGLIVINEHTAYNISSANGLRSNKINHLFTNGGDSLWVCTNAGVDLVILSKTLPPLIIPVEPRTSLNAKALTVVDDQIYIAADEGLYLLPLDGINSSKESELFFELTAVTVNNTTVHPEDLIRLKHNQNSLQFSYQAVSFTEKPVFRYKLEHLDDNWHTTKEFNIRYHNIPPGEYNLVIEAYLPGRERAEKVTVPIRITPAIYNTWWFKITLVLVLGTLIYLFFRFNIMHYNRSIVRELLRHLNRRLKREQPRIIFRDQGKVVQLRSTDVLYMRAANNNVEIHTINGVYHPRMKLGDCMNLIPDKLEYMQIHRSYIVRIDQIDQFDRTSALIGDQRVPVGPKYQKDFVEFMAERS